MSPSERSHYLQLLADYYQQTGEVEQWEGKYYLVLRWYECDQWIIEVVDRRTGEIERWAEIEYRAIEDIRWSTLSQ